MDKQLQDHAVLNLLHLCDQDTAVFTKMNSTPQYNILTDLNKSNKINTTMNNRLNNTVKITTEVSYQKNQHSSQNKENLKRILQKLRDSPSPNKKKIQKKKQPLSNYIKTEPQSRLKLFRKTPQRFQIPKKKMSQKDKQKELIKSLVKAKIIQKLKSMEHNKSNRQSRQQSFRISTVRQFQNLKRGQISISNNKKEQYTLETRRQINNRYNLQREQRPANRNSLINGKCSLVNLKHLLF